MSACNSERGLIGLFGEEAMQVCVMRQICDRLYVM